MEQKDEVGLLFVVLLFFVFPVLWPFLGSNTLIGRLMRSQGRREREARRGLLSGCAVHPERPGSHCDASEDKPARDQNA